MSDWRLLLGAQHAAYGPDPTGFGTQGGSRRKHWPPNGPPIRLMPVPGGAAAAWPPAMGRDRFQQGRILPNDAGVATLLTGDETMQQ